MDEANTNQTVYANTDTSKSTIGKTINTWVQTIAIVAAGVWALYTFLYKEVIQPGWEPAQISNNIEVTKIGMSGALIAYQVRLTISNSCRRTVHVLPSALLVYATKISQSDIEDKSFVTLTNTAFKGNIERIVSKHLSINDKTRLVAAGPIFSNWTLRPGETVSRTWVFEIPRDTYSLLDIHSFVHGITDTTVVGAEWQVTDDHMPRFRLYKLRGKERTELDQQKADDIRFLERQNYGQYESSLMVPVWNDAL